MPSRLSRRLAAFLCTSLLALTVLVGTVVTSPSGLAGPANYPFGRSKMISVASSVAYKEKPQFIIQHD